ncbi:hypothetical protein AB5I41_28315 [Sphingomonas sp. MMS24-JH45]
MRARATRCNSCPIRKSTSPDPGGSTPIWARHADEPAPADAGAATRGDDGIAVLARLAPNGEVAHEEDIGEFAVLRNAKEGRGRVATPINHAMVDDDFMLPAVADAWLAGPGRAGAAAFLDAKTATARNGDLPHAQRRLGRRAHRRLRREPRLSQPCRAEGRAQDRAVAYSEEGLGRGTYAYDVNAVWVPAALRSVARMAPLLARYGTPARSVPRSARRPRRRRAWERAAPPLFATELPAATARRQVAAYAATLKVPADTALASLGTGPLSFNALSLDAQGRAVPVLHSDDGFALLFGNPDAAALDRSVDAIARPFPAGLMTSVGLLVANPAYAATDVQARFGPSAYHGTVVWSWQQAVMAAGLDRQLARTDLPPATREARRLADAPVAGDRCRGGGADVRALVVDLHANGGYRVAPFGASSGDADEFRCGAIVEHGVPGAALARHVSHPNSSVRAEEALSESKCRLEALILRDEASTGSASPQNERRWCGHDACNHDPRPPHLPRARGRRAGASPPRRRRYAPPSTT